MQSTQSILYKIITITVYFLLFPLIIFWQLSELYNTNISIRNLVIILFVLLAPLLVLAPGMVKGDPKTYQWSLFLSMLYFVHGTMEAYAVNSARLFAGVEVGFSIVWFVFAILYIRAVAKKKSD